MDERLTKQLAFALELDKEKSVFRRTHLSGPGRLERLKTQSISLTDRRAEFKGFAAGRTLSFFPERL